MKSFTSPPSPVTPVDLEKSITNSKFPEGTTLTDTMEEVQLGPEIPSTPRLRPLLSVEGNSNSITPDTDIPMLDLYDYECHVQAEASTDDSSSPAIPLPPKTPTNQDPVDVSSTTEKISALIVCDGCLSEETTNRRSRTDSPKPLNRSKSKGRRNKNTKILYRPWRSTTRSNVKSVTSTSTSKTLLVVKATTTKLTTSQTKALQQTLDHLRTILVPLVSVTTGLPHPQFPTSILRYHLLTHDQLDSLAGWYHQTLNGGQERWLYPVAIDKVWLLHPCQDYNTEEPTSKTIKKYNPSLATKRRRFGRFIGLRGCESPIETETETEMEIDQSLPQTEDIVFRIGQGFGSGSESGPRKESDNDKKEEGEEKEEEEEEEEDISTMMEREWQKAIRRAEEEKKLREKMWRGWL